MTETSKSANNLDKIHYLNSAMFPMSYFCQNKCPYCSYRVNDGESALVLNVPYLIIQLVKEAAATGCKEILCVSGDRPDKYSKVRNRLGIWGFDSYLSYVYTICEMVFLEGFIPVVEVGSLSGLSDYQRLSEICSLVRINLDAVNGSKHSKIYPESPGKLIETRLKNIRWAMQAGIPVSTGLLVGIGETPAYRQKMLNELMNLHKEYGLLHDVILQNFVPQSDTVFAKKSGCDDSKLIQTIQQAQSTLSDDVILSVNPTTVHSIKKVLESGVTDFGRLYSGKNLFFQDALDSPDTVIDTIANNGYEAVERLSLSQAYIAKKRYPDKLSQLFISSSADLEL
ncbi:hypothetical protein CL648_04910 [bacterium]|nr:hypothetical protein [bacterium]|tara:strand:- start:1685 stop:2704 length:1020 start_codon:yes stop_codon:yes gene_type:complete